MMMTKLNPDSLALTLKKDLAQALEALWIMPRKDKEINDNGARAALKICKR
jgi:hypothetical protein